MIVSSPLCRLIFYLCCSYRQWFGQEETRSSTQGHFTSLSTDTYQPDYSLPPSLSAHTDKYLFPRWRLLTASKPGESPTDRSSKTQLCFPLTWGKLYPHYQRPSSASTGPSSQRSIVHQRGDDDTVATQSTAWQLDRLSWAASHIPSQSISDKPAERIHQTRKIVSRVW